jgi:hypothetical protein
MSIHRGRTATRDGASTHHVLTFSSSWFFFENARTF